MPANTKHELLEVTTREFRKLDELLAGVPRSAALSKDDEGISIKDIITHRAHWIDLFFGWFEDGQAGRDVHFPAKGYKWNQLKEYNANLRAAQSGTSWTKARDDLRDSHSRLTAFIESSNNEVLYGGPMKGARNSWSTGRWAEAAGPSHYRSASKYIRARLKDLKG